MKMRMKSFVKIGLQSFLLLALIHGNAQAMSPPLIKKSSYAGALKNQSKNLRKMNSASGLRGGTTDAMSRQSQSVHDRVLYHATTRQFAKAIVQGGVRVDAGTPNKDFGQGFYTTHDLSQAQAWARRRGTSLNPGAIVRFVVDKGRLDGLQQLHLDQVSPVIAERILEKHRIIGTTAGNVGFDTVEGPMLMNVRDVMANTQYGFTSGQAVVWSGHQLSFHTSAAAAVLNSSQRTILSP